MTAKEPEQVELETYLVIRALHTACDSRTKRFTNPALALLQRFLPDSLHPGAPSASVRVLRCLPAPPTR